MQIVQANYLPLQVVSLVGDSEGYGPALQTLNSFQIFYLYREQEDEKSFLAIASLIVLVLIHCEAVLAPTVIAQGGRFGGWCLYLKDGKPTYTYNFLGLENYTVSAQKALPKGQNRV